MICPQCNNDVRIESARFCNLCGTPLAATPAPPPPSAAPEPPPPPPPPPAASYGSGGYPAAPSHEAPPPGHGSGGYPAPSTPPPPPPGYGSGPGAGGYAPAPATPASPPQGAFAPQGGGQFYQHEIIDRPSYSTLVVYLQANQSIRTESGAMVAMSAHVDLQSQVQGGIMGALKRVVTRESIFQSIFTAKGAPGEIVLAPSTPGDVVALELRNQSFFVQGSSYLAGDPNLQMDAKMAGLKGFFSGEGLFLISLSGTGSVFLSSYGSIMKRTLRPGERYVVDTGHIVAFESTISYQLRKAAQSGWLGSLTSGEGVVAEYTGPGDIYLQTRNLQAFAGLIYPLFPSQNSGGGGFSFGS